MGEKEKKAGLLLEIHELVLIIIVNIQYRNKMRSFELILTLKRHTN